MLERGGALSGAEVALLQATFLEAHVAQRRVIEDRQLDEAALGLAAPATLKELRERADAHAALVDAHAALRAEHEARGASKARLESELAERCMSR